MDRNDMTGTMDRRMLRDGRELQGPSSCRGRTSELAAWACPFCPVGATTAPHPTWHVIPTHTSVSQVWVARTPGGAEQLLPDAFCQLAVLAAHQQCPKHQYPWLGVCILCLCDVQYSTTEEPNRWGPGTWPGMWGGRLTCARAWEPEPNRGGERGGGSAVAAMTAPEAAATRD